MTPWTRCRWRTSMKFATILLGTKPFPSPLRRDSVGERPAVMLIYLWFALH